MACRCSSHDVPSVRISLQLIIVAVVYAFLERCLRVSSRCLHTSPPLAASSQSPSTLSRAFSACTSRRRLAWGCRFPRRRPPVARSATNPCMGAGLRNWYIRSSPTGAEPTVARAWPKLVSCKRLSECCCLRNLTTLVSIAVKKRDIVLNRG